MMQFYFLSIAYIVFSSFVILPERLKRQLSFLILFRAKLREEKKARRMYFLIGFLIGLGTLFFPVSPGPRIIGDFIPSFTVLFLSLMILFIYSDKREEAYVESLRTERFERIGKASLIVALMHFLFPFLVLV